MFNTVSFVYESIRSLAATRSSPISPTVGDLSLSGLRVRWLLTKDEEQRSFLHLIWLPERWPEAEANVRGTRAAVWDFSGTSGRFSFGCSVGASAGGGAMSRPPGGLRSPGW
jgi:hypothetical protein